MTEYKHFRKHNKYKKSPLFPETVFFAAARPPGAHLFVVCLFYQRKGCPVAHQLTNYYAR